MNKKKLIIKIGEGIIIILFLGIVCFGFVIISMFVMKT